MLSSNQVMTLQANAPRDEKHTNMSRHPVIYVSDRGLMISMGIAIIL